MILCNFKLYKLSRFSKYLIGIVRFALYRFLFFPAWMSCIIITSFFLHVRFEFSCFFKDQNQFALTHQLRPSPLIFGFNSTDNMGFRVIYAVLSCTMKRGNCSRHIKKKEIRNPWLASLIKYFRATTLHKVRRNISGMVKIVSCIVLFQQEIIEAGFFFIFLNLSRFLC